MRRIIIMVVVMIIFFGDVPVQAATVTGETPLGGFSYELDKFFNSGKELYSEEDLSLLAEVMYHENYCNGDYIMLLTGSVVLNRAYHCSWCPDTIREVLYQPGQYATVKKFFTVQVPDHIYELAKQLLIFGSIAPPEVVFQSMNKNLGSRIYYQENGEYFAYE